MAINNIKDTEIVPENEVLASRFGAQCEGSFQYILDWIYVSEATL